MRFWDSSAMVPLTLEEPRSPRIAGLLKDDEAMVAWWGSMVECASAYARQRRNRTLSDQGEVQALRLLHMLAANWTEIQPSADLRSAALRLLSVHPLRAADSLQLAAALIWADFRPRGHAFLCLDDRLRDAAQREGFTVLPEPY